MKVVVVSDAHLFKSDDGRYWCNTAMHGQQFWKRYLTAFDEVEVIARVKDITDDELKQNKYIPASGQNITVRALPFVRGMKAYIFNFFKFKKACKQVAGDGDCAIFRLPSIPAYLVLNEYKKNKKPYAVEVVIDPEDEYAKIPLLKILSVKLLQKVCRHANGVSYVTQFYLQGKYPSRYRLGDRTGKYFESYYSSIDLKEDFFYYDREYKYKKDEIHIVHIANSINNENKGHRVLLKVVSELKKRNVKAYVNFIGNGDLIDTFTQMAKDLEIDDRVRFVGYVSSKEEIRQYLIDADMFVFPTRAEGLPRALIEAMATGLPCLSSNVDGIPELLDSEYLFAPDDIQGYANKIFQLTNDTQELEGMGKKNILKAEEYRSDKLMVRRNSFYNALKNLV